MDKKYITPLAIVAAGIIFSGTYFYSEYRKERQNETKNSLVSFCISDAERKYERFIEDNKEENKDGTFRILNSHRDRAEEVKQNDIDLCFRRYK